MPSSISPSSNWIEPTAAGGPYINRMPCGLTAHCEALTNPLATIWIEESEAPTAVDKTMYPALSSEFSDKKQLVELF